MPTTPTALIDYLRHECDLLRAASGKVRQAAEAAVRPRVPLEVAGMLWSAEVETVADDCLELIVDQHAARYLELSAEATIQFQPDNDCRHRATGRVTRRELAEDDKVRVSFEPL